MPTSGNRRGGSQSDDVDTSRAISNKDYYPIVDQMIHSEDEALTMLSASIEEENVGRVLRASAFVAKCCEQNKKLGLSSKMDWRSERSKEKLMVKLLRQESWVITIATKRSNS